MIRVDWNGSHHILPDAGCWKPITVGKRRTAIVQVELWVKSPPAHLQRVTGIEQLNQVANSEGSLDKPGGKC